MPDRQCRRLEAPAPFAASPCQELQSKSGAGNIGLLAPFCFRSSCRSCRNGSRTSENGTLLGFPLPETSPCGKSRIRICWSGAKGPREIAVAEAALDDVFIDDISFPA